MTRLFAAAILVAMSTIAHAQCAPAKAKGAVAYQWHPSGALLIAYQCPNKSVTAFAALPEWAPLAPPKGEELSRLYGKYGYAPDPHYLEDEAKKLIAVKK